MMCAKIFLVKFSEQEYHENKASKKIFWFHPDVSSLNVNFCNIPALRRNFSKSSCLHLTFEMKMFSVLAKFYQKVEYLLLVSSVLVGL